ncbi:MAG: DNAse [Gammaproteobacteria bacterium HGW-Gammaproteobacteria-1]|nr:MAG: DNAse [Gammaproteobacteria bacterium HGW-Gammaproteobacteria-1]
MRKFAFLVVLLTAFLAGGAVADELRIASWNIEHLGHGNQKSYPALAQVAGQFDFIAVQEVMTREGLERLKQAVEQHTGERWGMMHSHLIGRGSYKEKYAFLWRAQKIEYVDGAVVYLDRGDRFAREPYSARFRARDAGMEFVAATVHVLYGKSKADREPEIRALRDYWLWLSEVYAGTPTMFLMGDFNMSPAETGWGPMKAVAWPVVATGASTLSTHNGRYANLYDNIWAPRTPAPPIKEAGVYRYPEVLGWSHEKARKHVSDHAPVYLVLQTKK